MSAPRMHPSGTVAVTTSAMMQGRIEVFGFGQDERCINPGDLLIVSTNWLKENSKSVETEFALKLRGRDIDYFVTAAINAKALWDENKHWLQAPSSQPGLDTRPLSVIRADDNISAYERFMQNKARGLSG